MTNQIRVVSGRPRSVVVGLSWLGLVELVRLTLAVQSGLSLLAVVEKRRRTLRTSSKEALSCSFCAKSQFDVVKLVAGPGVYICNECVDLCTQVIAEALDLKGHRAGDAIPSTKSQIPQTLKAWGRYLTRTCSLRWCELTLLIRTSTVRSLTTSPRSEREASVGHASVKHSE